MRDGSTPRALAWELRHSVFGTTTDLYRLLVLQLLLVAQDPDGAESRAGGDSRARGPALMSFI